MSRLGAFEESSTAYDFEQVTVTDSATALTSSKYSPADGLHAQRMLITCETADIRYRYDGTNPTAAVGHTLAADASLVIEGHQNISALRMIRTAGTNADVFVTYER